MEVIIQQKPRFLKETGKFGREGEIYELTNDAKRRLAKIYEPGKRTAFVERKVVAIINKLRHLDLGGLENFIAYPEFTIYDKTGFCGFLMKNFENHTDLFDKRFSLREFAYSDNDMDDDKAVSIASTLFAYLRLLHSAGFIIGDINPDNILLDRITGMPALVDFDSVQLGTYFSNTNRLDYSDPSVRVDGFGMGKYFIYTVDSDIFAMAIVCYEFLVGVNPYFFQTSDATDTRFHKDNNLSFIDYCELNHSKIDAFNFAIIKNAAYDSAKQRLEFLKCMHPALYSYFRSIFSEGQRDYFALTTHHQSAIDAHSSFSEIESDVLNLLPQSKEDPEELELLMAQFNLSVY